MDSTDDSDFYHLVESHFVERRGSPLFISPSEWSLIRQWDEMGIPLNVVIEGIDRVFERPKTSLSPRRLGYCRQTVEAHFRKYCEAQLGSSSSHAAGAGDAIASGWVSPAEHVKKLSETVRAAASKWRIDLPELGAVLEQMADRLLGISAEDQWGPDVEKELAGLESELSLNGERLLAEDVSRLKAEAEAAIGGYRGQMPDDVFRAACESAFARRLRRRIGIPTLSLFDR